MRNINLLIIILILFNSCSKKKRTVQRISDQKYTVVIDSIFTQMPGTLLYQDGIVYWHDAFSADSFMHAIDVVNNKEICSFGKIGDGPQEFVSPLFSLAPSKGLCVNDIQKDIEILYDVKNNNNISSISESVKQWGVIKDVTSIVRIGEKHTVYLCPSSYKPFTLRTDKETIQVGKFPFSNGIANGYDMYQGNVAYNSNNGCLVYNIIRFPYTAVYKFVDGNLILEKELKPEIDYSVSDGEMKLGNKTSSGAMEIALTKDYIVLLQRDEEVEGKRPEAKRPRDMSILPHSLYVYDYNLDLIKIINMPFPLLRLCGDKENNTVYAVGINPEFMIFSTDLNS